MRTLTRLHQLLLIIAILSGCYSPELRDCTVTCSGANDCASGQICGSDGFCAGAGVAGTCGPGGVDAGIDAAPRVMLRLQVEGTGRVEIVGAGMCGGNGPDDCTVSVPRGPVVITAITTQSDKPFERWTTPNCAGQPSSCMFTATTATTIGAKFK